MYDDRLPDALVGAGGIHTTAPPALKSSVAEALRPAAVGRGG